MKWIGRIIYVILVVYVIMFIQQGGGAQGLSVSSYATDNLKNDQTVEHNLLELTAVSNTYIEKQGSTINFTDIVNNEHLFDFNYYRFGTFQNNTAVKKNGTDKFDMIADGYFIYLKDLDKDSNVIPYVITFDFVNSAKPDKTYTTDPITISTKAAPISYFPEGYTMLSYYNHILRPYILDNHGEKASIEELDFSTMVDFKIVSMTFKHADTKVRYVPEGTMETGEAHVVNGEPIEMSQDLISRDQTIFTDSKPFEAFPTREEVKEKDTLYYKVADLGKYFYWHIIVWSIYVLLVLVVPFFLWFRKPLMAHIAYKKELKKRQEKVEVVKQQKYSKYKTVQEAQIIKDNESDSNDKE